MDWDTDEAPRVVRQLPGWNEGMLTTRPLTFSGGHLFVNADLDGGELRVEVLDRTGAVVAPFTREACEPARGTGTRQRLSWRSGSLSTVAGRHGAVPLLADARPPLFVLGQRQPARTQSRATPPPVDRNSPDRSIAPLR